jgi:hypothetical protein
MILVILCKREKEEKRFMCFFVSSCLFSFSMLLLLFMLLLFFLSRMIPPFAHVDF